MEKVEREEREEEEKEKRRRRRPGAGAGEGWEVRGVSRRLPSLPSRQHGRGRPGRAQ